jgi:hypothetical protein
VASLKCALARSAGGGRGWTLRLKSPIFSIIEKLLLSSYVFYDDTMGIRAMLVHAIAEDAKQFFLHFKGEVGLP